MNDLMVARNNRYLCQLDYVKLIASMLVVALHTHPLQLLGEQHFVFRLLRTIADIAVPFFFLSSGYMLFSACRDGDDQEMAGYIKAYIKRIARQYCIWSLVYLPISVYGYLSGGASIPGMAVSLVRKTFCWWGRTFAPGSCGICARHFGGVCFFCFCTSG